MGKKITQFDQDNSPSADDYLMTVDSTSGENKKVLLSAIAALGQGLAVRYVSNYDSLTAAVTSISTTTCTLIIDAATTATANTTVPSTCSVVAWKGGIITHSTYTITVNGNFEAGMFQVFSGTGTVTLTLGPYARPEWFCGISYTSYSSNTDGWDKAIVACNHIKLGPNAYYIRALNKITNNNFYLEGSGFGTVIVGSDTEPIFWISGDNSILENFRTYSGSTTPAFIRLDGVVNSTIRNITFQDVGHCSIENVTGYGLRIENCKFQSSRRQVMLHYRWSHYATSDASIATTDVDIANNQFTVAAEGAIGYGTGRIAGDAVRVASTDTPPAPLVNGGIYYVIRVDATTIKLATSPYTAAAGTAIDLTDVGTGTHSITGIQTFSNQIKIDGCDFTHSKTYTGVYGVYAEGCAGLNMISNIMENFNGANDKAIYIPVGSYIVGLNLLTPYFENNNYNLYVDDTAGYITKYVHDISIINPASLYLALNFHLGTFSNAVFLNCLGSINLTADASGYSTASIINCPYYTVDANTTVQTRNGANVTVKAAAAPTGGSWTMGDIIWRDPPASGQPMGWMCNHSGTFGAATDNTGDTTNGSATIAGMTDTSDIPIYSYVDISAGFASAGPHLVIGKTSTTITVDASATSDQSNVTVDTSDPTFVAMANAA